jgi:hypothetical protein
MGEYQYHVAERAGALVGVVGIRNPSHLYHLLVDDRYQRQGFGGFVVAGPIRNIYEVLFVPMRWRAES